MEMVTFEREEDDEIPATTEETTFNSTTEISEIEQDVVSIPQPPPETLLTLLDDKNRSICLLKRQVHNQKLQLSFYLHRVFNSPKIIELSEGCVPYETEENIPITLAMNKFYKKAGLKSRIMVLHSRMADIEKRIVRTLEQQEEMIHVIVTKIIEFKTSGTNATDSIQLCLSQLKKDCGQVEILAKVLAATNKLRKELDTFRTCCNRLLVIEDERNGLVEQVYSMPVAQRMSYGVLLATQYEKIRLEKEVEEIKQDQKLLKDRFASLSKEYNASNIGTPKDDPGNLTKMLNTVTTEALSLLETTREKKDKYLEEISKLKQINLDLSSQLFTMKDIVKEKEELEETLKIALLEIEKLKEYDQKTLNEFNLRLENVIEEKNSLERRLQHYGTINEQMRCLRTQVEDIEMLRGQRDYYKLQVDDLQAIRSAYAQLVEHCPARGDEGDSKEQTGKIARLEEEKQQQSTEVDNLRELVGDQELQIKHLLIIIEKLAAHKDTTAPIIKRTLYSVQTTSSVNKNDSGCSCGESKSVYSQTDTTMMMKMMMKELQCPSSENINVKTNFGTQTETDLNISETIPEKTRSSSPIPRKNPFAATTVEVQSVNSDGKRETLTTILESSIPLDGVIEVNNSSTLSLRLTCTSSTKSNKISTININEENIPITNNPSLLRIATPNLDEFELMKDASRETLAVAVPSIRQQMLAMECVEYTCNDNYPPPDDSFNRMLKRNAEESDEVPISKETFPEGNDSDEEDIIYDEDEELIIDEEINQIDYEAIAELDGGTKAPKISDITGKLQLITSNLDRTLNQPGGKDYLLTSMKLMYNTFLNEPS